MRGRPFLYAEARAAGITDSALRGPEWRQVFRGVWAHRDCEDTREFRFAAVRLVLPRRAVVCGLTAAWLYDLDVRREDDLDVHVCFPKGGRIRRRPGLVVSQETLDPDDVLVHGGLQITTPVRTAFDCLRLLPHPEGLVVADALTHTKRVTVGAIRAYFGSKSRLRNLRIGAALVDRIEPKSESPMETRVRVLLEDAGLGRPEAQWEVHDAARRFVARLDLAYPDALVAVEYDGAWHWKQRREDDRRRAAVRRLGWEIVVVSADDYYATPERVRSEVAALLRERPGSSSATYSAS